MQTQTQTLQHCWNVCTTIIKKKVDTIAHLCYSVHTIKMHRGQTMQNILNRITYYFLNRAYTQLEATGELQNADDCAEFLEDYFAHLVN